VNGIGVYGAGVTCLLDLYNTETSNCLGRHERGGAGYLNINKDLSFLNESSLLLLRS
jgi:hypothetical protein